MNFILLGILSAIVVFFENNGQQLYFYYNAILLASLLIGVVVSSGSVFRNAKGAGRRYGLALLLVMLAFLAVELLLVHPTTQLYNDESIHMSIAKSMLYDHSASICSFSIEPHCVNGTSGLFQQPTGWPMMLSVAYLFFGISFATAFNLALLLSLISIPLLFYVAFLLTGNKKAALLSSALLAFTPLFLTFSRSTVLDISELTLLLLSLALLLTYLKDKDFKIGVAAAVAIAYTLIIKVDAIAILPIAGTFLLLGSYAFANRSSRRKLLELLALMLLLFAIITPQLIFLYVSWNRNTFGANPGQARFSIGNFESNLGQNAVFWLGAYGSIVTPYQYQTYNIEYPITYTLFAAIGLAFLVYRKRTKEALVLAFWFLLVFVFYTSYYGGGALYGGGDDIRYFIAAFPAIATLAALGICELCALLPNLTYPFGGSVGRRPRKRARHSSNAFNLWLAVLLLAILFSDPIFETMTVVLKAPQNVYPFAAARFQQQIITGNYLKIPSGCFVLTYDPPLWNVLNVSNIYADWFFSTQYRGKLLNLSHSCLYFEYSFDCIANTGGYGYDNTTTGCPKILGNFSLSPVVAAPYDRFGWDYNFTIYRIEGYRNGTQLK